MEPATTPAAGPGPTDPGEVTRPPGRARRLELILSAYAVVVLAIAWIGVGLALTVDPELPDSAWESLIATAIPVQVALWVLFLPITLGLWIWTSDFPAFVPVAYGLALALWTLTALRSLWGALRRR